MENKTELQIERVFANPDQPRKEFDPEKLEELAMSIREYGVIEPIVVTRRGTGFMIIAGERRWRASKIAGKQTIPANVIEADDALVEEIALLENLQREDLNIIEEAKGFKKLLDRGLTKAELARKMGIKQEWRIDERLNLLKLSAEYQSMVIAGRITNSQAFEMSRVSGGKQTVILRKILAGELDSYNKLRSFVDGLLAVENQECMFALQTLTPSEEESIKDFAGLLRSIEKFIKTINENGRAKHFKKVVFHTDINSERVDIVIQELMKLRKTIFEGAGIKKAMKEAV